VANYGIDFYGLAYYGTDNLVDFDASPFRATAIDYGKILVTWAEPTGNWSRLRLLRNPFGFPMTPDDGDLLFDLPQNSSVVYYEDIGQVPNNSGLLAGHTYYYSIFVRETTQGAWVKAGESLGVSVKNYDTISHMYDALPEVYKINNVYSASYNLGINDDVYNFLRLFAFNYDAFKTNTQNVSELYDVLNLDGRLVPLMLNQFGLRYEPEIGLQQARIMLKNIIKINSEKGSLSGLKVFVKSFSGFNCDIAPVINLMIGTDNSSFRETIGYWAAANATLTRGTLETESPKVAPYEEINSPANYPNGNKGFLKITSTGGDIEITCGQDSVVYKGIPVKPGTTYALSAYARYKTTNKTFHLDIKWYDRFGTLLGTAGEQDTTTTSSSDWVRLTASTGPAPTNAYFAVPYIRLEATTSGDVFYLDAVQFEAAPAPTTFADARRVDIVLRANRINEILNPSLEYDTSGWVVTSGTLSREAGGALTGSEYHGKIVATGGAITITNDVFTHVNAGEQYTISFYLKSGVASASLAAAKVDWYTESYEFISDSVSGGQTIDTDYDRYSATFTAPENAVHAKVSAIIAGQPAILAGEEYFIDAVLFERASYLYPYFDGSIGYQQTGDLIWEGTAGSSRSHYYKNRINVQVRLADTVGDYLPYSIPWAIFLAQPDA